jgi:cytochrome c oxidase subunit IV
MADSHQNSNDKMYLAIAGSLAGLTAISWIGDLLHMPRPTLICLVLLVALVKATLVATFFMHLKVDWTKVKVMIIPAMILAAILVFALMPDITLAQRERRAQRPPVETPKSQRTPAHGH